MKLITKNEYKITYRFPCQQFEVETIHYVANSIVEVAEMCKEENIDDLVKKIEFVCNVKCIPDNYEVN